jgi:Dyp-type peroxidase family
MADDQEPLLDAGDVQGNILPGFNRKEQYFVAFSCEDKDALQSALAMLRPGLTTLATALEHRDDRKRAFIAGEGRPQRDDLWLNLALGPRATDALGAPEIRGFDQAFDTGMKASVTGDPTAPTLPNGTPNPAHRNNWVVGSRSKPVDVLLIFAHDRNVAEEAEPVVEQIGTLLGAVPNYREKAALLPGGIEHFGFRDGVSQAGVRGRIRQDGVERPITTRYDAPSRDGVDFGKPGQPLVWPGQFLTGQPNFPGDDPGLAPEFTNGSFLVFRRLRQDVKTFDSDTEAMARKLSAAREQPISAEELRAWLVGRFRSGAALMRHERDPGKAEGPDEINYFAFAAALPSIVLADGIPVSGSAGDPDILRGRRCPVWAHIRKVNPRDLGTDRGDALVTLGFQMLRRGIPFGPIYDRSDPDASDNAKERGLLFLSYQRSIDEQFGSLNRGWMNQERVPHAGGFDLLVGQNVLEESGSYAAKSAIFFGSSAIDDEDGTPFEAPNQWVIPTGGAFLFAPSISFLDTFAPVHLA